jgi:protein-S-isoprenylcysteine O-methyltransferase Ste14
MQSWFLTRSGYLWVGLWVFWLVGALAAKPVARRQSARSRIVQSVPVVVAFYMLFASERWPWWLRWRVVPESPGVLWTGLALTAIGIALALLARIWIGRNWSGTVTIKEKHELIQGGPYAFVRHPIYSGLLLAFLGTAMIEREVRAFAGLLLVAAGWWMKLRTEESFMLQQFGPVYADYRKRVKALIPFVV